MCLLVFYIHIVHLWNKVLLQLVSSLTDVVGSLTAYVTPSVYNPLCVWFVKVFSGVVTERPTTTSLDKETAAAVQVSALLHCACRAGSDSVSGLA